MNKVLLLLMTVWLFGGFVFSQDQPKFNLTKDGIKPVVLTFDVGFTANQIYTKTKEWVALTHKDSKAAYRIDKENTLIKIGGFKDKAWKIRTNGQDYWYELEYTLQIEIKAAKCRVTFETPEVRYKVWYNNDGTTIDKFKDSEASFEASINELLTGLYTHIKGPTQKAADDW